MLSGVLVPSLVLMLSLFASSARAEFGEPYVKPSSPMAGKMLSVNIYIYQHEYCDGIFSAPGYPQVTQEGSAITIVFFGSRYESMDACPYMPGVATRPFGSYPTGSYTLTVKLRYANEGGDFVTDTLGVIPFTVTPIAAEATAVPTLGSGTAIVCLILLSFTGALALRRRRELPLMLLMAVLPVPGHSSEKRSSCA